MQKTVENPETAIEEELSELDVKLRQLRIQYQQFFNGGMKLPPWMLRTEIDRMVRRYANTTIKSFAHRYRFNNIQSKYQSYCELWGRQMRNQEEGARPSVAARSQPKVQEQLQPCLLLWKYYWLKMKTQL